MEQGSRGAGEILETGLGAKKNTNDAPGLDIIYRFLPNFRHLIIWCKNITRLFTIFNRLESRLG